MANKKIVLAVMVVDDDKPEERPEFYKNVSVDVENAAQALPQAKQWVSEQMLSAKISTQTK
ncbi:hypothetical protein [Pseudoalteromonas sp. MMG024]|uniref:hypothetical protein n=1 Tax=Pseudoalteromonas sp. MMG024 TaxID=2909980 RepID=UPI001F2BDFE7|nr:hypothetical protein [Pseudoalteromonas sp. MMG024]MCF6459083.1 hypothetical protein [Pseudoalteromonas sp. MMG024]